MRKGQCLKVAYRLAFVLLIWSSGYACAYDSYVATNLYKTRDALLDQRSHLQQKADDITRSINQLERQLNVVRGYLRDTDRNIRDVEDAIRRVK